MKRRLLLVNCYREKANEEIRLYRKWLETGGNDAGLKLEILPATDTGLLPGGGVFDAAVLSGSHKMIGGRGEIEPGLLDFIRSIRRPLLGICYGHQALARAFGGRVVKDARKHLGDEIIRLESPDPLFSGLAEPLVLSESHEEIVVRDGDLQKTFRVLAVSGGDKVEAIRHRELPLYGVQFHPEQSGGPGKRLLANFLIIIAAFGNCAELSL